MIEELDLGPIEEALEPSFSGMQDMLNEVYISDAIPLLIAEVKRLRQDRAEVRRDAFLEAAKAVCTFCAKSDKPWKWGGELQGFMWYHENPNGELIEPGDTARSAAYCKATNIHKLLPADQGQGKE